MSDDRTTIIPGYPVISGILCPSETVPPSAHTNPTISAPLCTDELLVEIEEEDDFGNQVDALFDRLFTIPKAPKLPRV